MYIVVGSVTTAVRLGKLIEKLSGYPAEVVHTPSKLNKGGCSYSVKSDDRAVGLVKSIAKEYGVNIKKIYTEEIIGGERVFRVIP